MKIYLALFISLVWATESQNAKNGTNGKLSESGFDRLDSDTFYYVMAFLDAREVLSLKILSQRIYHMVKRIWPRMELYTSINGPLSNILVDFSHRSDIYRLSILENQMFPYKRAQLSCLRNFSLLCSRIYDLQAVINLLPRDSLTSLRLQNLEPICPLMSKLPSLEFTHPLINKIDFPKLIRLELIQNISLNHDAFSSLPNCMRAIKLQHISMDAITSSSFAKALRAMDELDTLSLALCKFPKYEFSIILENLPASLRRLDVQYICLSDPGEKLIKFDLKGLKEMKSLQEIKFVGVDNEFALEIISNLPGCITNIEFNINRETLYAFKERLDGFESVKSINLGYLDFPPSTELISLIQKVFPGLDDAIKEKLGIYKGS